jgi:hypothetical protein
LCPASHGSHSCDSEEKHENKQPKSRKETAHRRARAAPWPTRGKGELRAQCAADTSNCMAG